MPPKRTADSLDTVNLDWVSIRYEDRARFVHYQMVFEMCRGALARYCRCLRTPEAESFWDSDDGSYQLHMKHATDTEATLEQHLINDAKKHNFLAMKTNPDIYAGIPDRVVFMRDRSAVFVELKRKGGSVRPAQRDAMLVLASMGQLPLVVRSYTQIRALHTLISSSVTLMKGAPPEC